MLILAAISQTAKNITMIIVCLIVGIAMFFIFTLFLKKLRKIENDFWGKASEDASRQLADARAKLFADSAKAIKKH